MGLFLEIWWAVFLLVSTTVAIDATIYISGSPSKVSPQALSPSATRLLLARRLGLSQYHTLEGTDDSTLRVLNDFGGEQQPLLSTDEQWLDHQRNLIIIDGVENPEEIIKPELQKVALTIPNPPYSSHTQRLVEDLFRQAQEDVVSLLRDISSPISSRTAILHITLPDAVSSRNTGATKKLSESLSDLLRPDSSHETTIVLMPPSSQKSKHTSTSPYGNYAMPESQHLRAREVQSEALLTAPSAAQTSLASHRHSTPQTLKASSVPRPGILPVCHSSLDKLLDATNNCSGHGLPYLKHNGTSEKNPDCYACKCRKTVIDRGDSKGVKTVEWAGPACSKKDLSMPFWLLAGISIAMVATVSWGVGLLFSIGQEELPSVIGAGVAGPRAQK
ncbi:MAG: hypothetical protein Q9225_007218 [Loekoesia sp. 1 TL-2023]